MDVSIPEPRKGLMKKTIKQSSLKSLTLIKIKKKLQYLASVRHHPKISQMNAEIDSLLKEAFETMGFPFLYEKIQWQWNSRLTSTMGMAFCLHSKNMSIPTHIEFSPSLFLRAPAKERKQIVFHEVAHCVDYYTGNYDDSAPHGPTWQRLMVNAGLTPDRCHNVEIIPRATKRKKHKAKCGCENGILISGVCYTRIKLGDKYTCRACKKNIEIK
jgi:predicted SprT family Zn-dependent metalloprotease